MANRYKPPPNKALLKYGEVKVWFHENGLSERKLLLMIDQGRIKRLLFGHKEYHYITDEIEREVFQQLKEAQ